VQRDGLKSWPRPIAAVRSIVLRDLLEQI